MAYEIPEDQIKLWEDNLSALESEFGEDSYIIERAQIFNIRNPNYLSKNGKKKGDETL